MLNNISLPEKVQQYCTGYNERVLRERLAFIIQKHYDAEFVSSSWESIQYDEFLELWMCVNNQGTWYISKEDLERINDGINSKNMELVA